MAPSFHAHALRPERQRIRLQARQPMTCDINATRGSHSNSLLTEVSPMRFHAGPIGSSSSVRRGAERLATAKAICCRSSQPVFMSNKVRNRVIALVCLLAFIGIGVLFYELGRSKAVCNHSLRDGQFNALDFHRSAHFYKNGATRLNSKSSESRQSPPTRRILR